MLLCGYGGDAVDEIHDLDFDRYMPNEMLLSQLAEKDSGAPTLR